MGRGARGARGGEGGARGKGEGEGGGRGSRKTPFLVEFCVGWGLGLGLV